MARNVFRQFLLKSAGGILPAILPPIHIMALYHFWKEYGRRVNRQYCSCSCWDTIFKGTYESGVASYKHFYFNATANTTKIWVVTVVFILVLYETTKHIITLAMERKLRYLMAILFATSLFAHYYTWWIYINYWNDDFYSQWNHQLFFTLTEFISTAFVVNLADKRKSLTSRKVVVVISIAIVHILAGGLDQFLENVVYGEGLAHQILRDLMFMIPDIFHVFFPLVELFRSNRSKDCFSFTTRCDFVRDLPLMFTIITGGLGLSYLL